MRPFAAMEDAMLTMIRATVPAMGRSASTVVLAAALLLAACGGTPAAPGGATNAPGSSQAAATAAGGGGGGGANADFCKLISPAEVAGIVGKPIASTEPGSKDCTWTFNDTSSNPLPIGGTVLLRTEDSRDATLQGPKIAFPKGEDVSGIGDRAYWVDGVSVLYFVKGSTSYAVQLVLFDNADPRRDIATKVALLALSRL